MSEAVVERVFSKMKLILTNKRTRLDNNSLDAALDKRNIGTRSSAKNSRDMEETMPKKNIP